MGRSLRYYVRVSEGVFRRVGVKKFHAFFEGTTDLGVGADEGHIKYVEIVVETKGRQIVGEPLRVLLGRYKVGKNGRIDRKFREEMLHHAVDKTFNKHENEGKVINARVRFMDRASQWELTKADREALRGLLT